MEKFSKWTIATLNRTKIFEINPSMDGKPNISGIEGEMIKILMEKVDIDYEIVIPKDTEFGRKLPSGNWTGLIGMVHRGEADMAIGTLGIYEDRYEVIDFGYPYITDGVTFVILKANKQLQLFGFLHVFGFQVWLLILFTLFLVTSITYASSKGNETFFKILFNLSTNILRQPLNLKEYMSKHRITTFTWLVFALMISYFHSAILLSFLAIPTDFQKVRNFRQLSAAIEDGTHRAYTLKSSNYVNYLLNCHEDYLKFIGEKIEENHWDITAEEMTKNPLKNKSSAILGPSFIFRLLYGSSEMQSKVLFSEDLLGFGNIAIAFRKDFCCTSKLYEMVSRLLSSGILNRIMNRESFKHLLSISKKETANLEAQAITIKEFYGAFLFLLMGLSISLLVFLGEIFWYYFKIRIFKAEWTISICW
ncbi:glutamate receptor ionotropic, delta-2 [Trichonephila clavata]|uniref:Glutamate receptor ionotropic, delta-2 n=1 Tax=Trichonephila clavata TaxID=2740835 RepID=A0A8X6JCG5_TRICU|nr:glutamate receptor ionotropic, delta-2 [Trichonephila clavata]